MSCKGLDEAGFSARNTTARRAYSEVLEIMNSPYSDNWVLTSNLMDLPLKVPGKVPLTLTKVLPSKAPAVWLEPRSPFHRWARVGLSFPRSLHESRYHRPQHRLVRRRASLPIQGLRALRPRLLLRRPPEPRRSLRQGRGGTSHDPPGPGGIRRRQPRGGGGPLVPEPRGPGGPYRSHPPCLPARRTAPHAGAGREGGQGPWRDRSPAASAEPGLPALPGRDGPAHGERGADPLPHGPPDGQRRELRFLPLRERPGARRRHAARAR